jgi:ParB-like chromosome segregation protein Spo0J
MTRLRISDLLANSPVDPQAHLDAERVARYAEILDSLPPIVVFDTAEGLLVADGYHRLAAARLRGKDTIEAEIRHGSRHDALRYAAMVGAAQHAITADEAMEYIRRRNPEQWQGRR